MLADGAVKSTFILAFVCRVSRLIDVKLRREGMEEGEGEEGGKEGRKEGRKERGDEGEEEDEQRRKG